MDGHEAVHRLIRRNEECEKAIGSPCLNLAHDQELIEQTNRVYSSFLHIFSFSAKC
jgi:uncharacterized protein YpbB